MPCYKTNLTLWASKIFFWSGWRAIYRVAIFAQSLNVPCLPVRHSRLVCLRDLPLNPCCLCCMPVICLHQYRALLLRTPCLLNTVFSTAASSSSSKPCCLQYSVPGPMSGTLCSTLKNLLTWSSAARALLSSLILPLLLSGKPVPLVTTTLHLSLIISSTLKWSARAESILSRVCWNLAPLKRLFFRCHLPFPVFSPFL